jgi:hypothetical protein
MKKTKRAQRLLVRVSTPLLDELNEEAKRDGRPVADYARRLLIDAMTAPAQRRELQSIDAARRGQTEGEASHGL